MEKRKEKNGPTYVPQFGAWDNKAAAGANSGYTMEFSQARANKQQHQQHQQHKNGLGARHGLANDQQQQHKNGLGARHGLTNDQEFPGKKQEDPSNMKNGYRSVPQFGMWDQQTGGAASYTVEFSKARVNRKQHKNNDLLARPPSIDHEQEALRKQHEDSCMRKKKMLAFCCIGP
ncbi:uncharacterized protein LOC107807672 [Nicotiana tabacum]|uniref:Uncharacterized protein LOC107807672 n=1 Tax=Nicotiana tabacum TaxID=4097 RepID=A0A1S4BF83_TOBAC|nr:uncharacterized protein LOC104098698 [Nicotiana tomentosiformis]XP_016487585.1 PREDICTED: uncharacterized protein LOC107807672 [Nicotiana tabacum]